MSQERPIWNDGQGLATPDLQRPCNDVGAADDRVQFAREVGKIQMAMAVDQHGVFRVKLQSVF